MEQRHYKIWTGFFHMFWNLKLRLFSFFSIKTLGARALVVKDDQVLLVKHSYHKGWCTVGGGIEKGETSLEAIKRELLEEVGVTSLEDPKLMGVYHAISNKADNYVVFYIVKNFSIQPSNSLEISEKKWFGLDKLPEDITPATLRRVEEYLGKRSVSEKW